MPQEIPTQPPDQGPASPLTHLRPCTPMEMLDRATALLRSRWRLLLPLGLLHALPDSLALTAIVAVVEGKGGKGPPDYLAPVFMLAWLASQWPNAAMIIATINGFIFPDRHIGLWISLRYALARLPYLILTRLHIMFTLVLLLMPLATLVMPSETEAGLGGPILLMAAAGLVAAVFLALFCMLVPPIVMVEHKWFFRAMGRSIALMRPAFKRGLPGDRPATRVLLLLVVPAALYAGAQAALNGISYNLTGMPVFGLDYHPAVWLATAALMFPAKFLAGLWLCAGVSMLYLECRMRTEGFDLFVRLQARTRGLSETPAWAEETD